MSDQDSRTTSDLPALREVVTQCILCSSTRLKPWRSDRPDSRGTSQRLTYLRCLDCGCRTLSPRVPEGSVGEFYGHSYAPYAGAAGVTAAATVGRDPQGGALQQQLASVYPDAQQDRRVLDFGCGSSTFLNSVRELGWQTVGADFTQEGLSLAREAGHEVQLVDDEFWPWLAGQQFDVIRLSHVIEHLYDPSRQLAALMQALKEGGVLHVATPDPLGPACSIIRRRCVFFEVVHVSLIPPASLAAAARRLGASKTIVQPETVGKDIWRSWLLAMRRISSYEGAPEHPRSRLLHAGLAVLALVASKLGRNDRYHAFVIK